MPIHVNKTTLHHACQMCGYLRLDVSHAEVEYIPDEGNERGGYSLVLECLSCGARECLNTELYPQEEQCGHLGHQQQAAHIRQLQQHLGLPRVEERQAGNPAPNAPPAPGGQ